MPCSWHFQRKRIHRTRWADSSLLHIRGGQRKTAQKPAGGNKGVSGIRTLWTDSPQKAETWPSGSHYAEYFTCKEGA